MIVAMIEGADVVIGKSQGYIPLPIRIEPVEEKNLGLTTTLVSAWTPTPAELEELNAGANIHVRLYSDVHPPINVSVGKRPGVLAFQDGVPA